MNTNIDFPFRKKIVYLDQHLLSNIAKSIDPLWKAETVAQDPFWTQAFDALDRALKLHLIVCPESRVHAQESVVHKHFPVLRALYEHFAAGTSFDFPTQIHLTQLTHALDAALNSRPIGYETIPRQRVIHGPIDEWMDRYLIQVRSALIDPDPTLENQTREKSGLEFAGIFSRWAQEKPSFEECYQFERRGYADAMCELLRQHYASMLDLMAGDSGVFDDLINPRLEVDTLLSLTDFVQESGMDKRSASKYIIDFLYSEGALSAPYNEITSLLMAALSKRASMGQKRSPSRGMWLDITAISAFLPYCDAMFIDNECADLLGDGPLRDRINFQTKIFSRRTGDEFLDYLQNLESEADPWLKPLVTRIYGKGWLVPYRTILEQERKRGEE